jgi:tetrapyrrole methylase family protein/MazG family protein
VHLFDAAAFARAAVHDSGPYLLAQCWSRHLLSEVKLSAPDEGDPPLPRPTILHHLGLDDEVVATVEWWELDRTVEPDHLTSLYVPALGDTVGQSSADEVARLVALMDTLREHCPWDRAQTHASLMPHLVEECYEVLDALASLDGPGADATGAHLQEELGDLLFQIVFHARLAQEEGRFDLGDVARTVHDKLVHRHPHVFGDVQVEGADEVVSNWEAIKKREKGRASVTEGIPAGLPALMLTTKLARKARSVGLDPEGAAGPGPDGSGGALAVAATMESLARRAGTAEPSPDDPLSAEADALSTQVGQVLFEVATLAQRLGVDAEQALRDRALALRADILVAEGVPDQEIGNR